MSIVCDIIVAYILVIFARIVLSWLPISPDSPVATVSSFIHRITEPLMGPLRRALPPLRMGNMMMDLSPIVLLFVLQFVVLGIFCRA